MKKFIAKTILVAPALVSAAVLLFSCASTGEHTENFNIASEIANFIGLNSGGAFLGAAASASRAMEDITPENEYYIGRAVGATILTNFSTYENKNLEAYVNKICMTLAENSDGPSPFNGYHVKLLDSEEKNAFATSGGHIFITKGLVSCAENEDALAAIIAHEMAHIQKQHSLKAIKASRWTQAGFDVSAAAIKTVQNELSNDQYLGKKGVLDSSKVFELADSMNGMVEDVVANMVNNGYSKSQEFEADELALTLLIGAGYNPRAMVSMLNELKAEQGSSKSGMYKTHPDPEERIRNVNLTLKKLKAGEDTSSYREERFKKIL